MPRFFFNIRNGAELTPDPEGQELPDTEAARREAVSSSREMLGERLLHGGALDHRQIEITDAGGHVVDVIPLSEVLFRNGKFLSYEDDVTQTAPVNRVKTTN